MPIIKDGFEYGLHNRLKGFYLRLKASNKDLQILTDLTSRQQGKFKKKGLIPYPLIQFFWDLGFLPIMKRPPESMRLPAFLDLLSHGAYTDDRHRYMGIWLRDKIQQEECLETKRRSEKYIGRTNEGKLWPASFLSMQPGTMIK